MEPTKQTWLITGCSSGLGEAIAHAALRRGDNVIATARRNIQRLQALKNAGAATLELDVQASQPELNRVIQEALGIYGGIDVLVNNAGYAEVGVLEELTHEQLLAQYHTNFFGAINVTRSLLPHMRAKTSGSLVYLGSMGAYISEYASIPYISSKNALDGFIDCMNKDVGFFNIKCMLAVVGEFRTNIYSETNLGYAPSTIEAYASLQAAVKDGLHKADNKQLGDPVKAAERLVDGVKGQGGATGRAMPARLIIGADAFQAVRNKCQMMLQVCDDWEEFGTNTNLEGASGGGFVGSVI